MWTIPCNPPWLTPGDEARNALHDDTEAPATLLTYAGPQPGEEASAVGRTENRELAVHSKPAARSLLIDAVRGMAISLVALGHTNQGILHRGWWGGSPVGIRLDILIYAFHMPAFFFVSGIFVRASVTKRGPGRFTVERLRTLIYPYLLWSVIAALAVRVLARFMVQRPLTIRELAFDVLIGAGVWFLPALFVCQMFAMVLRRLPGAAIVAIALLAYFFHPHTRVEYVELGIHFFPFVAAGMWLGRRYERLEAIPRWGALSLAVILFAALYVETYKPWTTFDNAMLLSGLIGTVMLLMLARTMGNSRGTRVFAWAGEASLAIYLAGEYGQGFVRQVFEWAHITSPYTQLILPTIAAIAIPAWVYQRRVRLHLEWLFIAPFWKPRPRVPQTASAS